MSVDAPAAGLSLLAGQLGGRGTIDGTGSAARFGRPQGIVSDGSGTLYVADEDNHTIRKMVLATGVVTTIAGTATMPGSADGIGSAARFDHPRNLALGAAGILYIADSYNDTIRQLVVATGAVSTLAGAVNMPGDDDGELAIAGGENAVLILPLDH